MNTRTRFTNISVETKKSVHIRDGGFCIICGKPVAWNMSNAHIVPRSKGGLGIEENIVTLCAECHHGYDQTKNRFSYNERIVRYIKTHYPSWSEESVTYKKGVTK